MIQQHSPLTDTHCHLNSPQFETDLPEVLGRAAEAGLIRILIPGLDLATSRHAVHLASSHESLYVAVGVHPHHAGEWSRNALSELRELAQADKVIAVGEIGLDHYRDYVPRPVQLRAFREQLDLARELELPVVMHNRDSVPTILREMRARKGDAPRGVLHAFAGDARQAEQACRAGFHLGVGGTVTFPSAEALRSTVAGVPPDRLLLETDAPYLAPQRHRGARNEPAYVRFVAEELGLILHMDVPALASTTYRNSVDLFGWADGN